LSYGLNVKNYSDYDLENQTIHNLNGNFKQRLGELFTADFTGEIKIFQLPNIDEYNWSLIRSQPNISCYVFDHTSLTGGYVYGEKSYDKYDLDYKETGFSISIEQELSLYTYLEIGGSKLVKDYLERGLYNSIGTQTDQMREDESVQMKVRLSQDISESVRAEISYRYDKLDSNGNYYDYGPGQSETENTITTDDQTVDNYYSYESNAFGSDIRIITDKNSYLTLSGYYQDKRYGGRLAKDNTDNFITPNEKRRDKNIFVSADWFTEIMEDTGLKFGFSYEIMIRTIRFTIVPLFRVHSIL